MSVRDALGGPWSSHWLVLVALLPPATLLALFREVATPFPEWWWPPVSALVQHAVTAMVVLLGGVIARSVHTIVPTVTIVAIWSLGAALRGVVAGAFAEHVAGVDGEYLSRMGIWTLTSLIWVPPFVYAIAQFERRRFLLGAIDITEHELERERPRADASSATVQRQLRAAVAESLRPALNDLQQALNATRDSLDRAAVAELSLRVSRLHDDADDLAESAREAPVYRPRPVASLRRAMELPPRRPWLTAAVVGNATLTLVVLDVWRIYGDLAAIEVTLAVTVAALVIGAVPAIVGILAPQSLEANGQRTTTVAGLLGISVAIVILLTSGIDPITEHGLVIIPIITIGLAVAIVTASGTLLVSDANADAQRRLEGLQTELRTLHERNEAMLLRRREQLAELMHGPVQGRIAACIMALNFHAAGSTDSAKSAPLVEAMLEHLSAVSRDVVTITAKVDTAES